MAELKTKPTNADVDAFLSGIEPEEKRRECFALLDLMEKATNETPRMWGNSIVGFGLKHYKYDSGREGDWMPVAFAPRKTNLTLYFMSGFDELAPFLSKLGKYKTGKGCLYINHLKDVNLDVLRQIITASYNNNSL